jgi:hypothetical protein
MGGGDGCTLERRRTLGAASGSLSDCEVTDSHPREPGPVPGFFVSRFFQSRLDAIKTDSMITYVMRTTTQRKEKRDEESSLDRDEG